MPAIIVPAGRRAANLDHAITLARAVQCHLVLLCSKDARTEEVHAFLDDRSFGDATVVNVPSDRDPFGFKTTRWVQEALPKECGHRDSDLSVKRNIGLAIARMLGWERIFFMDDDIRDIDSHAVLRTVSMLGWKQSYPAKYNAVGMRVTQFPDNSVACHANRLTGEFQDVFISGSALAVDCTESFGFFPDIYNEDWLFFYKDAVNGHLGSSGVAATQLRYDPFANPHRAASEEFGDVIAEGLYALLEHGTKAEAVTEDDWQGFLDSRRSLLSTILGRQDEAPAEVREHMADSIRAALASLRCITPDMCIEYVKQWQDDLTLWARVLRQLPRTTIIEDALAQLGLATAGHSPRARPDDISIPAAAPPGPAAVPWSRRD
ncbi:MAG TPA: hypothetical protein VHZ03_57300 [Trebonia sp.]|nr:hypothetical protein [Trebonia sp.]